MPLGRGIGFFMRIYRNKQRVSTPGNHSLLITLSLLAATPALSIDICLPSIPAIGRELAGNPIAADGVIALFALAFGIGHLFSGWLVDNYGRRRPIVIAMLLYCIAALSANAASSLTILYWCRAIQGFTASTAAVGFISIARDKFSGSDLAQWLAKVGAVAAIAPVLAPLIGAHIQHVFGWRVLFLFLGGYGFFVFWWLLMRCPETRRIVPEHSGTSAAGVLREFFRILSSLVFIRYAGIHILGFCGLFSYLISGSLLMIDSFKVSPATFGIWFSANAVVFAATNLVTARLARRISIDSVLWVGASCIMFGASWMWYWSATLAPWAFCIPMFMVTAGVACILPHSSAGAMQPFGQSAGRAAALLGFLRFAVGAFVATGLSSIQSAEPVAKTILLCGVFCLACCVFPKFLKLKTFSEARHL